MKPRDLLSALCILYVIHSCGVQGILEVRNILNQGMRPQDVSKAVNSASSFVEQTLRSQDSVARQAFDAGIDKINTIASAVTEHIGPELLTSDKALEIERAGQAFLATANVTASRFASPDRQFAPSFGKKKKKTKGWRSSRRSYRRMSKSFVRKAIASARLPASIICPYARSRWPRCRGSTVDKYRTYDGSCNNKNNLLWGRANTPFERFIDPHYGDGVSTPRDLSFNGGDLPLPRKISTDFHTDLTRVAFDLSHLAMEYGQFVSHDIQFNALSKGHMGSNLDCCRQKERPNCFPIKIPANDPHFPPGRGCMNMVRSIPTPNLECTLDVRQQLNQNTHYLDGSAIYGSDKKTADSLRTFTGGSMKTDFSDNLPPNDPPTAGCIRTNQQRPCFKAGDRRVNQQPGLMSLQTIWLREHNRVAAGLEELNVLQTDEELYQEARKIVIAMLQHITYNEYLPIILGDQMMTKYGIKPQRSGFYTGYSATEKGIIRNGFMTAAYRFGHSMIYHKMPTFSAHSRTTNNDLKDIFLKPDLMYTHGVDQITRGLMKTPSENVDRYMTPQITRHLFERQPGFGGDLAAININRGRDHGIEAYHKWREYCGLPGEYSHSPYVIAALKATYGHYKDIDLFTGGVSETPVQGGKVGPTFACLIGEQFRSLKKGDRFFYENGGDGDEGFNKDHLESIKSQTLSKIICRNTRIVSLQRHALKSTNAPRNPTVNCRHNADMDLSPWGSGMTGGCIPVDGAVSNWQYTPCLGNNIRIRYRLCNNPSPNECGRPCFQHFDIRVEFCGRWNNWYSTRRGISGTVGRSSSRRRMRGPFGRRMSRPVSRSSTRRGSGSVFRSSTIRRSRPVVRSSTRRRSGSVVRSSTRRRSRPVVRSSTRRRSGFVVRSSSRRRMSGSIGRSSSKTANRMSAPESDSARTNDITSQITAALSGQSTIDVSTLRRVASSINTGTASASRG